MNLKEIRESVALSEIHLRRLIDEKKRVEIIKESTARRLREMRELRIYSRKE